MKRLVEGAGKAWGARRMERNIPAAVAFEAGSIGEAEGLGEGLGREDDELSMSWTPRLEEMRRWGRRGGRRVRKFAARDVNVTV
jgi:hypothetical protein